MNGLTIAVPRGALFAETLDWLERLGIPTAEIRGNERKLLFEDVGLITMRPSDVPTYVAAGAADLGVTGRDVLMEQTEGPSAAHAREVYQLRDLGFGRCTMVVATVAGPDRAAEALEPVERLREQRAARDGDRQAVHSRSSAASARCSFSTSSANPTAGSSRPNCPSRWS